MSMRADTPVHVCLRTVTGAVHQLELPSRVEVEQLYRQAAATLSLPADRFKLIHKGSTLARAAADSAAATAAAGAAAAGAGRRKQQLVQLADGDVLLVMPQRVPAPSERLQRAAAEATGVDLSVDEDEAAVRFKLPADAPAWQRWLARSLQDQCRVPELLLVWLFTLGPTRLLVLALVLAGGKLASRYDLGPVYILAAIVVAIFTHGLGRKREGEASAYSVFNPGVARLPGQLDADVLDEQIRRGQM